MPQDLLQQIAQLKEQAARVQGMRATAEAADAMAQQQLRSIDEELKALGINPENADVEIAAMEERLQAEVTRLQQELAQEEAGLTEKLKAARGAGLIA